MQFIDLKSQYLHLNKRIDKRVESVLSHGKYIMGPEVEELEARLEDYVGVKHAITCANGTDALQLCMLALDIKVGDAVFCPTFTFFATAEVIAFSGATPVFVDSDEATFNISPTDLEKRIIKVLAEGKLIPKAIIAVDLFGLPANYPALELLAKKYNLKLIEDAAQGFGGDIEGKKAGGFGDMATTSFFPAKPLGCYGDGGAVFTNSDEYAELLRSYRIHGTGEDKYDNVRIGMNSRLDTIQAAILLEKLLEFPQELHNRNNAAACYSAALSDHMAVPKIPTGYLSSWAQYTMLDDNRSQLMDTLAKDDIPSMIYYKTCMHQQTAFAHLKYAHSDFPVATSLANRVFSIPMSGYIGSGDITRVIRSLSKDE